MILLRLLEEPPDKVSWNTVAWENEDAFETRMDIESLIPAVIQ